MHGNANGRCEDCGRGAAGSASAPAPARNKAPGAADHGEDGEGDGQPQRPEHEQEEEEGEDRQGNEEQFHAVSSLSAEMGATAALASVLVAFAHVGMGASGGSQAIQAVGESLAMSNARQRIEAAPARPVPESAGTVPSAAEIAADPSKLPPASAGSNGTSVPHRSQLSREEIFAHRRGGDPASTAILLTGVALAPPQAPEAVEGAINAANMIIGRPYVWGGGHGSFYSQGYDCSGSVSFALFGGGLVPRPLTSGELEHWGAPGPGRWITVYANAGHTFAEIAGLRWDTVGDEQGTGPRWHLATTSAAGFVARHPPGL
jgi:cell wall-associated NlpC family hydrolase